MRTLRNYFAFAASFFIEFDILIGGQTVGASAVGGYGYRISDAVCVVGILLLVTIAYNSARIVSLYIFAIVIVMIFAPVLLFQEGFGVTVGTRYILYSLSGLFLVSVISAEEGMTWFCYGMIAGVAASAGIFVLQDSEISRSILLSWGLVAGYADQYGGYLRETPRYSGLWGHPNEAGHVGALAAGAGAYFYLGKRRIFPLVVLAISLCAYFYYTLSRGGLIAGAATIFIALIVPRDGKIADPKFLFSLLFAALLVLGASQFDLLTSRFASDANVQGNIQERIISTVTGLQIALSHPLGMSIDSFVSLLAGLTGGLSSPHNGFIFMGAILGSLPLIATILTLGINFRVREKVDLFFAYSSLQICLSMMFEQMPGSVPYIFMLSLLMARAFVRSKIGSPLISIAMPSGLSVHPASARLTSR